MASPRKGEAGHAPVPPQNLDAEESVLGAIMIGSARTVDAVVEYVAPEHFYRESHAKIFRAILHLHGLGEPSDAIAVTGELERRGELEAAGGRSRLHELASLVPATANAGHYARLVRETALNRELIRVGSEISLLGWDGAGQSDERVDRAQALLFEVGQSALSGDFVPASEAVRRAYERLLHRYESGGDLVGLPTGLVDVDRILQGLRPANLILIAGRPSMGKSGLALAIAANVAIRQELPVGLLTMEMSEAEVTDRLIAMEARVDSQRVSTGRVQPDEWRRINEAAARIAAAPLLIDDSGALTALEVRSKARRLKARYPKLALVIIDYLQLMTAGQSSENRVLELAAITRQLKALSKELDLPVVALSQLSRAPEQRHDHRPMLSDLRESGALEQDADVVVFLYRDEYYHPEDTDQAGVAEFIIAKQRNGPTDTVKLTFVRRFTLFSDRALPGDVGAAQ